MATRRNPPRKQADVRNVAVLCNAWSAECSYLHRHFVATPVKTGVQVCVIEIHVPHDSHTYITDALTLIPKDHGQIFPIDDPVLASALAMSRSFYNEEIEEIKSTKHAFSHLVGLDSNEPPFAFRNSFASEIAKIEKSYPKKHIARWKRTNVWHPLHLAVGNWGYKIRTSSSGIEGKVRWKMLNAWAKWNSSDNSSTPRLRFSKRRRQSSWRTRAKDFYNLEEDATKRQYEKLRDLATYWKLNPSSPLDTDAVWLNRKLVPTIQDDPFLKHGTEEALQRIGEPNFDPNYFVSACPSVATHNGKRMI